MSEQKYESKIQSIPAPVEKVFPVLSKLKNLERVRELIPADKVQEMDITEDTVKFKVDGLAQKIAIRIVDKVENDTIKFGLDNMPMAANFWIQLKAADEHNTFIKLTVKVDLPTMFKMMIGGKIQEALDKVADMLEKMPFENWNV